VKDSNNHLRDYRISEKWWISQFPKTSDQRPLENFSHQAQVNDNPPSRIEHFEALQIYNDLMITGKIIGTMERQFTVLQGPNLMV
jgi:hypothetical protein